MSFFPVEVYGHVQAALFSSLPPGAALAGTASSLRFGIIVGDDGSSESRGLLSDVLGGAVQPSTISGAWSRFRRRLRPVRQFAAGLMQGTFFRPWFAPEQEASGGTEDDSAAMAGRQMSQHVASPYVLSRPVSKFYDHHSTWQETSDADLGRAPALSMGGLNSVMPHSYLRGEGEVEEVDAGGRSSWSRRVWDFMYVDHPETTREENIKRSYQEELRLVQTGTLFANTGGDEQAPLAHGGVFAVTIKSLEHLEMLAADSDLQERLRTFFGRLQLFGSGEDATAGTRTPVPMLVIVMLAADAAPAPALPEPEPAASSMPDSTANLDVAILDSEQERHAKQKLLALAEEVAEPFSFDLRLTCKCITPRSGQNGVLTTLDNPAVLGQAFSEGLAQPLLQQL